MKRTLLHVENLQVGYFHKEDSKILFENLSLMLREGDLICFMGPNGSGKSSLIRTLAGLQDPINKPSFSNRQARIDPKKISIVLTDRIAGLNMNVRELITFGRYPYLNWNARLSSEDHFIIDKAMTSVQINTLAEKNINELSDGQLQMVMIARALAQDTPIILLDEPTAHLDLNNRVEIMNVLRKLTRETKKAILVSTHELDLAMQTADLLWLADGNTILKGIPEDLVLNGSLDRIFQFKGFDLKTGKIFQETHRNLPVNLIGEGYSFLWTKNALERCGYQIASEGIRLEVFAEGNWRLNEESLSSIEILLNKLSELS
jgi:iron complex transport system ATP-binding protein